MTQLLQNELRRFAPWLAGVATLHVFWLYYLYSVGTSFVGDWRVAQLWLIAVIVVAFVFGFVQMKLHARQNEWLYLLQRPLAHPRIFLALAIASAALLLAALVLPPAVTLAALHVDGGWGIEARHYGVLPYAAGVAVIAWCSGSFAVLHPGRLAFLVIAVPMLFVSLEQGPTVAAWLALLTVGAFFMARACFKPDLERRPDSVAALLGTELPIQFGLFWALAFAAMLVVELAWSIAGNPVRNPPPGTDYHVLQLPADERLLYGLERSNHPDAGFLAQQVRIGDAVAIAGGDHLPPPRRGQLPFTDIGLRLDDPERDTRWLFKHGPMLFAGRDRHNGLRVGWLGRNGFHESRQDAAPFASIPRVTRNRWIVTDRSLFDVDLERGRVHERLSAAADDRFTRTIRFTDGVVAVLSELSLMLFDATEFTDVDTPLAPDFVLRGPSVRNSSFSVTALIDGYLVGALSNPSPTVISADFSQFGKARLALYVLSEGGGQAPVGSMPLRPVFGDGYVYHELVLTPGMRLLRDAFWGWRLGRPRAATLPVPFAAIPAHIYLLTALLCAACAASAWMLLRHSVLSPSVRRAWIGLSAFFGVAGLLSLLLGQYLGKRHLYRRVAPATAAT